MLFSKKRLIFFIFTTVVCCFIFILTSGYFFQNHTSKEISLLEACSLGQIVAQKWDSNARLYLISSVDGDPGTGMGSNGKRRYWNMVFAVPGLKKSLIITIHDKEVIRTLPSNDETNNHEVLSLAEIKMDSTDAILKASSILNPGDKWVKGYHFILSKSNDIALLEVVGADSNNKLKKIYFNAVSGEKIGTN